MSDVGARFIAPVPREGALPTRRSARLAGYDHARRGAYFFTICAHDRRCIFGEIAGDVMTVNALGRLVEATWEGLPAAVVGAETDAFVVMPNHVHGVIVLQASDEAGAMNRAPTLGEIVRGFKARVTRAARQQGLFEGPLWQRNHHEHVVRDEADLERVRAYIEENPLALALDGENPAVTQRAR